MPADRRFPPRRGAEERPHRGGDDRPFHGGDDRPHRGVEERPRPYQPGRPPVSIGRQGEGLAFTTSFRLRDGDREVEVSGSTGFVRQVLDELPALVARLRGEPAPTPASIRMPSPSAGRPAGETPSSPPSPEAAGGTPATVSGNGKLAPTGNGRGSRSLEDRVFAALRGAGHPLPVAEIRGRLGGDVSGQQVRRILERAGSQVVATADRPIRYRLR